MRGIIGAICGDIIGSTREFNPVKTKEFKLIPSDSKFTDDTVLTMAIANWLLKDDEHHHRTLTKEIKYRCNKYPKAGYGGRFKNWIKSENNNGYKSWGNGSAMRVSPVAWVGRSLEEVEKLAKISAEVTHNSHEGIKGAMATASCIYLARTGESKNTIKEYVELKYEYDLSRTLDEIRPNYGFEVSCQKSVPESIISFLEANSFEDTIRNAVSLGGDADTQAAIAGSISSAYYDVPEYIYAKCINKLSNEFKISLIEFNDKYNYYY